MKEPDNYSLFVILSLFFCLLCFLSFFDLQILINPLVELF